MIAVTLWSINAADAQCSGAQAIASFTTSIQLHWMHPVQANPDGETCCPGFAEDARCVSCCVISSDKMSNGSAPAMSIAMYGQHRANEIAGLRLPPEPPPPRTAG